MYRQVAIQPWSLHLCSQVKETVEPFERTARLKKDQVPHSSAILWTKNCFHQQHVFLKVTLESCLSIHSRFTLVYFSHSPQSNQALIDAIVRFRVQIHDHQSELNLAFETFASVQRYVDRCPTTISSLWAMTVHMFLTRKQSVGVDPLSLETCVALLAWSCAHICIGIVTGAGAKNRARLTFACDAHANHCGWHRSRVASRRKQKTIRMLTAAESSNNFLFWYVSNVSLQCMREHTSL